MTLRPQIAPIEMRANLIAHGLENLHSFGYEHATADNILTDEIYSVMFARMLRENFGKGADVEISGLLREMGRE